MLFLNELNYYLSYVVNVKSLLVTEIEATATDYFLLLPVFPSGSCCDKWISP